MSYHIWTDIYPAGSGGRYRNARKNAYRFDASIVRFGKFWRAPAASRFGARTVHGGCGGPAPRYAAATSGTSPRAAGMR